MANTSLTLTDIKEMTYPELEGLMDGMEKNSKREREEIEKGTVNHGNASDFLDYIGNNGDGF